METRRIGSLTVSVVGLGCNQIGTTCDLEKSRGIVAAALDHGVTFFDTADEYGNGQSEEALGIALQGHRNNVLIGSKFGCMMNDDPSRAGASARWIERSVEDSLRRLRTDRIDLYQLHFPDPKVPIEETLSALDRLLRSGKVREIGACNLNAPQIQQAADAAATLGTGAFRSLQTRLNLLRQEAFMDIVPTCERAGMSVIPFFPLASGLLSGKYRRGAAPPPGSRMADNVPAEAAAKILSDATFDKLDALERVAASHGRSLLELAIAWLVAQQIVGSVICGATSATQVAANVAASAWKLDASVVREAATAARGAKA